MNRDQKDLQRFERFTMYTGDCIAWVGDQLQSGYGQFVTRRNNVLKRHRAHRYAYELVYGAIPESLEIDHICRNKICVTDVCRYVHLCTPY